MCSDVTLVQKNKRSVDISFVKEKKNSSLHGQMGRLVLWSSCEEGMHIEVSILISKNSNYTRWNILIGYAWKKAFTQEEDDSCVGPSSTLYAPNVFILSLTKARSRNVWLYYAASFDLLGLFPSRSCIAGSESEGPSQLLIGEFEGWSKFSVRLKLGQKDLVWKCQCELWEIATDIFILD